MNTFSEVLLNEKLHSLNSSIEEAKQAVFKALSNYHRMQQEEFKNIFGALTLNVKKKLMDARNERAQECGENQKNVYKLLLQLYAKYKTELHSSKTRKKEAWSKIADEVKKSKSECRIMIDDLKSDYDTYKSRKVTCLELVDFLDAAKIAFDESIGNPGSNIFPAQECEGQQKSIHMLLLQLYAKYKTEFQSSKARKRRAWQNVAYEIQKKSPFNCSGLECFKMINDLKSDYQMYKSRKVTGIELVDFLDAAKNAFESVGKPGYSVNQNQNRISKSVDRHADLVNISKTSGQECIGDSVYSAQSIPEASKDKSSSIKSAKFCNNHSSNDFIVNNSVPTNKVILPRESIDKEYESTKPKTKRKKKNPIVDARVTSSCLTKNKAEKDDDEIRICTPPRKKSPPLIVLDEDEKCVNISASDTFAKKTAPYSSTSVNTSNNEGNSNCRTVLGDKPGDNHGQTIPITDVRKYLNPVFFKENRKRTCSSSSSSSSSSDGDTGANKIVTCAKKPALTGAIQPSHKLNNIAASSQPSTSGAQNLNRNLKKDSLSQVNKSSLSTVNRDKESHIKHVKSSINQGQKRML